MCKNATKTAYTLMAAIEPTIKSILSLAGLSNTDNGVAAINAYDAALAALKTWQSGTASQNVLQLIEDFQTVFNTLPIPDTYKTLANIVLAGIETVIGVVTANSPAENTTTEAVEAHEETQAMHAAAVVADTTAKVQALVPSFKRSIWHSPESQYESTWNKAVDDGGFDQSLKV